jgi:hypothetical protein
VQGENGDGTRHGEPIMAIPAIRHRRLAPRRSGPADCVGQHEAGSINEDEGAALTPGFF